MIDYKQYLPMLDQLYDDWKDCSYEAYKANDKNDGDMYCDGFTAVSRVIQLIERLEGLDDED